MRAEDGQTRSIWLEPDGWSVGVIDQLRVAAEPLLAIRPTAVNLSWAVKRALSALAGVAEEKRAAKAYGVAAEIC